jgi:hypothetical protein
MQISDFVGIGIKPGTNIDKQKLRDNGVKNYGTARKYLNGLINTRQKASHLKQDLI